MNICVIRKGELEELDKMVKDILRERKFHGRQASDERLYMRRQEGGRGLMSFLKSETDMLPGCVDRKMD